MTEIQQTKEAIEKLQDDGYRACPFPQMVEEGTLRVSHLKALAADHTRLASENERLREALEHYADNDNWSNDRDGQHDAGERTYHGSMNGYDLAVAALQPPIQGEGND